MAGLPMCAAGAHTVSCKYLIFHRRKHVCIAEHYGHILDNCVRILITAIFTEQLLGVEGSLKPELLFAGCAAMKQPKAFIPLDWK